MLEHVFHFQRSDQQVIEEVLDHSGVSQLSIAHRLLPPGEAMPHLKTVTDVHLIVLSGALALRLADQLIHTYGPGTIVTIPLGVMMEIRSEGVESLEFFTIQVPPHESGLAGEVV